MEGRDNNEGLFHQSHSSTKMMTIKLKVKLFQVRNTIYIYSCYDCRSKHDSACDV